MRPIAGTRRRGSSHDEDAALAEELLADQKERAEHVQLLDLGLQRCRPRGADRFGQGHENMLIERYSRRDAHRLQCRRQGCKPGLNAPRRAQGDPAGRHACPAPKVRAMEIIDELEPVKRGICGGAIGYLGQWRHGSRIAIRTAVEGRPDAGSGGASIVADSDPTAAQSKARARSQSAPIRTGYAGGLKTMNPDGTEIG